MAVEIAPAPTHVPASDMQIHQSAPEPDELGARMEAFAANEPAPKAEPKAPAKEVAKTPEKPQEQSKTEQVKKPDEVAKPLAKPLAKEDAKADEAQAAPAKEAPKTPRPWEMYRTEKKQREELEGKYKELEKEVATLRSQKPEYDPTKHPEFVKYKTRAEELENEIRFTKYESSTEFKEKYDQPYKQSWTQNAARATGLTVNVKGKNDLGEDVITGQRQVTPEEFWSIVTADDNKAIELADNLFQDSPSKSTRIQQWAEDVRNKGQEMNRALTEARKNATERDKQAQAKAQQEKLQQEQQSVEKAKRFHEAIDADMVHPERKEYFVAPDDDPKGKEILTKGYKFADKAFGITENGDQPFNPEEESAAHAALRNRAASWPYMKHLLGKSRAQIKELETKLAEYEKSEPGPGAPKGDAPQVDDSIDARLEKFAAGQF